MVLVGTMNLESTMLGITDLDLVYFTEHEMTPSAMIILLQIVEAAKKRLLL